MKRKISVYGGMLIPFILYWSVFYDLWALAPEIERFVEFTPEQQRVIIRKVTVLASLVYGMQLSLLLCAIFPFSAFAQRSSVSHQLFHCGATSGCALMYIVAWISLNYLAPNDVRWEDITGFLLVLICIITLKGQIDHIRVRTPAV